jgi:nitrosocyanin
MNRTIIVIVLLAILLGGFALVQSQKKVTQTSPAETTTQPSTVMQPSGAMSPAATGEGAMMKAGEVKEFTVEGKNFSFSPSTLTVNKGDTVKITFKNSGGMHDFVLDEFNVKTKPIESGASETVSFTADKAGTFNYYCSVGNHRAMGMQGTLTVK